MKIIILNSQSQNKRSQQGIPVLMGTKIADLQKTTAAGSSFVGNCLIILPTVEGFEC